MGGGERRKRREAAARACYGRGLGGGAPSPLFKGGRRAMGAGVLVGLPSLLGRLVGKGGGVLLPHESVSSPHKVSLTLSWFSSKLQEFF